MKNAFTRWLPVVVLALTMWVWPGSSVSARAATLDLATFFSGHLTASGKFQNFSDGTTLKINVDVQGERLGKLFRITMNTAFSDGRRERKVWAFEKTGDGQYAGRRADLVGTANVVVRGNDVSMSYVAKVPNKSGKVFNVAFTEIYQFSASGRGTQSIRASVLSIPVGRGSLVIRKLSN